MKKPGRIRNHPSLCIVVYRTKKSRAVRNHHVFWLSKYIIGRSIWTHHAIKMVPIAATVFQRRGYVKIQPMFMHRTSTFWIGAFSQKSRPSNIRLSFCMSIKYKSNFIRSLSILQRWTLMQQHSSWRSSTDQTSRAHVVCRRKVPDIAKYCDTSCHFTWITPWYIHDTYLPQMLPATLV